MVGPTQQETTTTEKIGCYSSQEEGERGSPGAPWGSTRVPQEAEGEGRPWEGLSLRALQGPGCQSIRTTRLMRQRGIFHPILSVSSGLAGPQRVTSRSRGPFCSPEHPPCVPRQYRLPLFHQPPRGAEDDPGPQRIHQPHPEPEERHRPRHGGGPQQNLLV